MFKYLGNSIHFKRSLSLNGVTRSPDGNLEDNKTYFSRKDTELTIATTDDYTEVFEDGTGILY